MDIPGALMAEVGLNSEGLWPKWILLKLWVVWVAFSALGWSRVEKRSAGRALRGRRVGAKVEEVYIYIYGYIYIYTLSDTPEDGDAQKLSLRGCQQYPFYEMRFGPL